MATNADVSVHIVTNRYGQNMMEVSCNIISHMLKMRTVRYRIHILAKDIIKEKRAIMAPDYYPNLNYS